MIRDADFMLAVLQERPGEWISQMTILQRSAEARGCGMTPHSRASDLRNRGHDIQNRCERVGTRVVSYYRVVEPSLSAAPDSLPPNTSRGLGEGGFGAAESEVALARPDTRPPGAAMHDVEPEGQASLFSSPRKPAWA